MKNAEADRPRSIDWLRRKEQRFWYVGGKGVPVRQEAMVCEREYEKKEGKSEMKYVQIEPRRRPTTLA